MKNTLFFLFLLATINLLGQETEAQIEVRNNQLTEDHINIPGTKVNLIPPEGFILSKKFLGLEKGEAAINVMDIPGADFTYGTRNFTAENFEAKGVKVQAFTQWKINGYQAILAEIETDVKGFQLVLGNESFTVMLIGMIPLGEEEQYQKVRESLLSIVYLPEQELDEEKIAKFEFDFSGTDLAFRRYTANIFFYDTKKSESNMIPTEATLMVSQLPSDPSLGENPASVAQQSIQGLKAKGVLFETLAEGDTTAGDLQAYYTLANVEIQGELQRWYFVAAGNSENIFLIHGMALDDYDKNIAMLQRVIHSFTLK